MSGQEQCPGSGRMWGSGTGAPICRGCRRGPRGLGVKVPVSRRRVVNGERTAFSGTVPAHERRSR